MCVRAFCAILVLGLVAAQDQGDAETAFDGTEVEAVTSATICSACDCSEGVLDCSKKNLAVSFTVSEWDELKPLNIKAVDLSGNSIEHLTVKSELPVETFNASNNRIESIEDWCFEHFENLTTLDLSRNELADLNKRVFWGALLPDSKIRSFAKMRYLSLAYNDLHVIPRDAFAFMHGLTFLDLSRNPLAIIDQVTMGTLSELTALRELRISACGLEALPEGLFRTQRRLERLDLSNNKFTTVPAVIGEATNLAYLNFDRNPITSLIEKTSISSLTKLRELRLCNTKLQTIGPGALGGLEKLEVLYICNNPKLNVIDEDFLTWEDDDGTEIWPALKEIYLYNNNMSEVDPDFLFRWDQLTGLSFVDNPFVCDCRNQWMVDVLVPLITSLNRTAADMICTKPQDVRGLSFAQLFENSKTLVCTEAEDVKALPGPDMAIILGVMIGIFVTFPLVLVIVLLWKKGYYAKCRRKMNSDRDSDEENDAF